MHLGSHPCRAGTAAPLELEAERDRNEIRVALFREHGVVACFHERLEAAQVEREATAEVEAELRLRVADVDAAKVRRCLQAIGSESADRVRPRRRSRVAKRKKRVQDEV